MQNLKIKRMSIKRINEWLKAIDLILNCYTKHKKLAVCPLCRIPKAKACRYCLWEIIEDKSCFLFRNELGLFQYDIWEARNLKKWRKARIPMLKNWKKILKAELKRRNQNEPTKN